MIFKYQENLQYRKIKLEKNYNLWGSIYNLHNTNHMFINSFFRQLLSWVLSYIQHSILGLEMRKKDSLPLDWKPCSISWHPWVSIGDIIWKPQLTLYIYCSIFSYRSILTTFSFLFSGCWQQLSFARKRKWAPPAQPFSIS